MFFDASCVTHIEELRRRIVVCVCVIVGAGVGSYFFSDHLVQLITMPLRQQHESVHFFSPYEALVVKVSLSFCVGLLVSFPCLVVQMWRFVAPGLRTAEKKVVLVAASGMSVCFVAGVLCGYFLLLPWVLHFLLSFQTDMLKPVLSIEKYISFALLFLCGCGGVANLPFLSFLLVRLRILTHHRLIEKRKYVVVGCFICAAICTPPDVFTQLVLAIPLLVVYEACIAVAWLCRKQ